MSCNFEQSEPVNGDHTENRQTYNSPPLKTLLALDLSCVKVARLEHELDKVARSLNLPNDWRLNTSNSFHHEVCQARAEWCLRWLLRALCTSELSFTHVRANVSSWVLLGRLISQLPVPLTAKALNINTFVKFLKDTLEENYSHVNVDILGSRLKDFERNGHGVVLPCRSKNDRVEPKYQSLFPAFDEVVRLILKLASNRSSETLANEQVKLSLKCDLSTAARVARLYIMGLNKHLLTDLKDCIYKISDNLIAPAAKLWEINLEDVENLAGEGSIAFASQCTLPLLYTLVILEEPQMDIVDRHNVELSRKTRSAIQYLIAKYLLSCAPAHLIQSQKERIRRQSLIIEPIIQEINRSITRMVEATDEQKVDSGASLALMARTVPLLFGLIVRSNFSDKSLSSEDKATRYESTFRTLAACLGVDNSHAIHRGIPEVCVTNVVSLVEITIDQNIELGTDTLVFVTQCFSGICGQTTKNVNWELIAVLFRICNDIYFRSLLEERDQNQNQVNHQLGTTLLKNLLHHLALKSNEILLLQPSPEFHEGFLEAYKRLKSSILYPLLVSFVRTRNIKMLIFIWRSELSKAAANYNVNSGLLLLSIWDDNELATHIAQLLQNYISMQEILSLCCSEIKILKEYVNPEQHGIFSEEPELQTVYHELYASTTVLNCLFSSLSNEGSVNELLTDLPTLISVLLKLFDELPNSSTTLKCNILLVLHQVYRVIWRDFDQSDRIVDRQQLNRLPWNFGLCLFERLDIYDSEVSHAELQLQYVTNHFLVSNWYECYVRNIHAYVPSNLAENLMKYMNGVLNTLCAENLFQTAAEMSWNGDMKWIRSLWHLSLANVCIVVQYPQILNDCDKEIRRMFLEDLCTLAARTDLKHAQPGFSNGMSYVELLTSLGDWVGTCSITEIRGDFVVTMTKLIESTPGIINKFTQRASTIAEDQVLRINPLNIGRDHREKILDMMLHVSENQCIKNFIRRLSIAVHLMETPNATAALCTRPEILWMIAKRLDKFEVIDVIDALQLQKALTQKILTYILQTQDQPRSKTFIEGFLCILQNIITEQKSYLTIMGTLATIKTSIQLLRIHKPLPAEFEQMYVVILLNDLAQLHQCPRSEVHLIKHAENILNALLSSQYSHNYQAKIKEVAKKVIEKLSISSSSLKIMCSAYLYEDDIGVSQVALMAILKKCYLTETIHELYLVLDIIMKYRALLQDEGLNISRQLCKEVKDGNCSAQLFLLREVISKRNTSSRYLMADQELSSSLDWLCDRLPETSEPHVRLLQLDCINATALNDGQSISQLGIENILTMITRRMLASDINHQQKYKNHTFSRFCSIIRTLLLCHRSRLKGRHHLLIQCLQALLAGFFLPYNSNTSSSSFHSGIVLLTDAGALDEPSAEGFCRILTIWCSPPQSSLRKQKSKAEQQLTDQAPRVKKYVSKFGINLLEHYCYLQLSGRIRPEIRNLIIPGLFALLDRMEKETMKTLNARLEASAQALWKILHGEWKKSLQHSG